MQLRDTNSRKFRRPVFRSISRCKVHQPTSSDFISRTLLYSNTLYIHTLCASKHGLPANSLRRYQCGGVVGLGLGLLVCLCVRLSVTVVDKLVAPSRLDTSTKHSTNGWPLMWVNRPLQVSQLGQLSLSSFLGRTARSMAWFTSCHLWADCLYRSSYTNLIDTQICLISGCLQPTQLTWLPVHNNVAPPSLRHKAATDNTLQIIKSSKPIQTGLCVLCLSASTSTACTSMPNMVRYDITIMQERGLVDGFCGQPHYCYWGYYPIIMYRPIQLIVSICPSSCMVSDELFPDRSRPVTC